MAVAPDTVSFVDTTSTTAAPDTVSFVDSTTDRGHDVPVPPPGNRSLKASGHAAGRRSSLDPSNQKSLIQDL